jgi:dienelactone hydrolase
VRSNNKAAAGGNQANAKISFPTLGPALPFKDNILFHRVMIPRPQKRALSLNIFIPKGNHAEHSLPVMLEAPNGTNLLHGAQADFPKPSTEYLPFTDQGMITVTFSIDGEMFDNLTPAAGEFYFRELQKAYKEFVDSDAGVENGKLALDYALAQIPAADSKRVYIWGHSSSATLALLMASKDKRIAKCIALAPITDLNARLGDLLTDRSVSNALPGLKEYLVSGSPLTHVGDLKCPVFLAHAKDDDNEPFQYSQAYVKALQAAGGNIVFEARASGGHYQELIDAAVPKAITWINESR